MHRFLAPCFVLLLCSATLRADPPTDPLRFVPADADILARVEKPRELVDRVLHASYVKQLMQFSAARELLSSTNARLFEQFIAYYEKKLGADRLDILERLAGGGIVFAAKYGGQGQPVLFVFQGTDEAFARKSFDLALQVAESELKRQDSKEPYVRGNYRDVPTVQIGKQLHAALLGSAIVASNLDKGLHAAIDMHLDSSKKSIAQSSNLMRAQKLLGKDPLAWVWFNFEPLHKLPNAKDVFNLPRNDANLTVLFGNYLDLAGRAPFLCIGAYADEKNVRTVIRMPAGREGLNPALSTHVPPADQPGSRPLLEPKNVMFSTSYYTDLAKFWENRSKLFTEGQIKAFEEFEKNPGVTGFLAGNRLSQLLMQAGAYQRFVVVHQGKTGYKKAPPQVIPAFAFVLEMRDPEKFARSLEFILRIGGLGLATQFKLQFVEERNDNYKLIGYRFKEDESLKGDSNDFRYSFSPCFAIVGNQFLAASTLELGRELAGMLEKEDREKRSNKSAIVTQFYARGGLELLKSVEDQLLAQAQLDQALPPDAARKEVDLIYDLVKQLGVLRLEANYGPKSFQYSVQWRPAK